MVEPEQKHYLRDRQPKVSEAPKGREAEIGEIPVGEVP